MKWYPVILCMLVIGCADPYKKLASQYHFSTAPGIPDYSRLDHWAAHPAKKDPSDSIPKPLQAHYHPDTTADIFFLHPTTYIDKSKTLGNNAPVDDAYLDAKTDYSTILFQASIFNEAGRVYAPRYRQANYYAYFPETPADTAAAIQAFELAYQDIKAAFLYYLKHENNGHPIIIAAHSQGSTHGKRLIKELFDGKPLQAQLVVAYLAGMPLEQDYFASVKPCNAPAQTGCACSWRTYKEGYRPEHILAEKSPAIVTNPLTWDASVTEADRSLNKGSVLLKFNKVLPHNVKARVADGVLWTSKPRFFGNIFYTSKNYHIADLNLFYMSLRENVRLRVAAFRTEQQGTRSR